MANWLEKIRKQLIAGSEAAVVAESKRAEPEEEKPGNSYVFHDRETAEDYLVWKKTVPGEFRRLVESTMKEVELADKPTGLTLTDQFLSRLGERLRPAEQEANAKKNSTVENLVAPIGRIKTAEGYIDGFSTLTDPNISWSVKQQIYEKQIRPALEWLTEKDLANLADRMKEKQGNATEEVRARQEEKTEEDNSQGDDVPPTSEEMGFSMETGVERKEGELRALFRVSPFHGGYYRQSLYNHFNGKTLKWEKPENELSPVQEENLDPLGKRIIAGKIRGEDPLALPLPYDWGVDKDSFVSDAPEGNAEILSNQEGSCYFKINSAGIFNYQIAAGPRKFIQKEAIFSEGVIDGGLPQELQSKIEELRQMGFPKMKLYRELVKFVRSHLKYSNSKEAWGIYSGNPDKFFEKIWDRREADCGVANTLAAKSLLEAGAEVRFAGGFYVKEKNAAGEAVLHTGNAHAWVEVWDEWSERPARLDATPKGDPNLDSDAQERELEGDSGEGDFGENEEELASEEEVKKQIGDFKKEETAGEAEKKKEPKYNLAEQNFADQAECTPEQAWEFLRALERVRKIKNEKGVSISELLKEEWRKIVRERKISVQSYRGPVRMDQGDQLADPVSAIIDIKSKEFNPTGFEKNVKEEKIKTDFGGLNIYFSFDLSGSMNEPDPASGRKKADVQRDTALLFIDSLTQCAAISHRSADKGDALPFKIMVTVAKSRGQTILNLTDKWTPKEQWAIYSALMMTAGGGTPTHETLALIEKEVELEMAELVRKKVPKDKLPVNYAVETTDGEPDSPAETSRMCGRLEAKGVTVGRYHIGKNVGSFSGLPEILARDVVNLFKKLKPK
jgi:hypothetical protein